MDATPNFSRQGIKANPYRFQEGRNIPPRQPVYGSHMYRQFLSTTIAPGSVGKSSLALVEALAIATGLDLGMQGGRA